MVSDLSTIAAAFDDGTNVVRVGSNLYLGAGELVVPAGKTLDLATNNVDLTGLSDNSKLIAEGDIVFNYSQNVPGGIQWGNLSDAAKIIASESFITKYVNVDYTTITDDIDTSWTKLTAGPSGVIKARWEQIILIQDFADFMNWEIPAALPDPATTQGYIFGEYLALRTPKEGGVRSPEAVALGLKASGLKLYLVGAPVIIDVSSTGPDNAGIDLTGPAAPGYYKVWPPRITPAPEASIVFNYGGDTNGSLTAAGSVDLKNGSVNSTAGFNVWGVLKNTGTQQDALSVTTANTPFTGLTVRLHGVTFGGVTEIKGTVRNSFGASATFSDKLVLGGPATFNGATFNGETVFSGPVIFTATGANGQNPVVFSDAVTFSNDVTFQGPAKFAAPQASNIFFGRLETSDLNIISSLKAGGNSASLELPQSTIDTIAGFSSNVKFLANEVTIGTASAITFDKDVTAVGKINFPNTDAITFSGTTSIGSGVFGEIAVPTFDSDLTVGGNVVFGTYATVTGDLVVGGNADFNGGAKLGLVAITGNATVKDADDTTFTKAINIGGDLTLDSTKGGVTLDVPAEVKGAVLFGTHAALGSARNKLNLGDTVFSKTVDIGSAAIVFKSVALAETGMLGSIGVTANITVLGKAQFIADDNILQGNLIFGNGGVFIKNGTISAGFDATAADNTLTVTKAAVTPDANITLTNGSIVFGANGEFDFLDAGGSTSIKLSGGAESGASVVATNTVTIGGTAVTGQGSSLNRAVLEAGGGVILTIGNPDGPDQSVLALNNVDFKLTSGNVAFGPGATGAEAGSLVLIDALTSGNIITAAETNNSTGKGVLVGGTVGSGLGYGIIVGSVGLPADATGFGAGTFGTGYLLNEGAAFVLTGTAASFGSESVDKDIYYSAATNPVAVFNGLEF